LTAGGADRPSLLARPAAAPALLAKPASTLLQVRPALYLPLEALALTCTSST